VPKLTIAVGSLYPRLALRWHLEHRIGRLVANPFCGVEVVLESEDDDEDEEDCDWLSSLFTVQFCTGCAAGLREP